MNKDVPATIGDIEEYDLSVYVDEDGCLVWMSRTGQPVWMNKLADVGSAMDYDTRIVRRLKDASIPDIKKLFYD
jgi:hypothetical protein